MEKLISLKTDQDVQALKAKSLPDGSHPPFIAYKYVMKKSRNSPKVGTENFVVIWGKYEEYAKCISYTDGAEVESPKFDDNEKVFCSAGLHLYNLDDAFYHYNRWKHVVIAVLVPSEAKICIPREDADVTYNTSKFRVSHLKVLYEVEKSGRKSRKKIKN